MPSRKCAHPGCSCRAMRGTDYCYAHHRPPYAPRDAPGPDSETARGERSAAFARALRAGQIEELIEKAVQEFIDNSGSWPTLNSEIGALRIVLQRVLAMDALDGDPKDTAATVSRLTDSIVRAVRAQRQISGDAAEGIAAAITTILIEAGMGGE